MAKMFYTLEEVAAKLGVTADQVREMAASGRIKEYRDRDRLVFKTTEIDLVAGGPGDEDANIPLADSGADLIALAPDDAKSGSGAGGGTGASTKDRSGISIFEADELEETDASAQTQITSAGGGTIGDPGASGSGLLDLTREADDTSLGANLLEDVYGNAPSSDLGPGDSNAGGALFEPTGVASDVSGGLGGVPMMMVVEPYDGAWSGIAGGLALGMIVVLAVLLVLTLLVMVGASGGLVALFASNYIMYVGILAAVPLVFAIAGWLMARNS